MKKSVVPPSLLPGSGLVSPSLLAHIPNGKYVLALPLYRQEQEFHRMGVPISRQTMANWVIAAYQRWFSEFFQLLRRELLANSILHADETTLMVLREPGRKSFMCGSTVPLEILSGQLCCTTTSPAGLESAPAISCPDSQGYCTQTATRLTTASCPRK